MRRLARRYVWCLDALQDYGKRKSLIAERAIARAPSIHIDRLHGCDRFGLDSVLHVDQNAYAELFNGWLRDGCLRGAGFCSESNHLTCCDSAPLRGKSRAERGDRGDSRKK